MPQSPVIDRDLTPTSPPDVPPPAGCPPWSPSVAAAIRQAQRAQLIVTTYRHNDTNARLNLAAADADPTSWFGHVSIDTTTGRVRGASLRHGVGGPLRHVDSAAALTALLRAITPRAAPHP